MALMPIFMGAFRSITAHKEQKKNSGKARDYDSEGCDDVSNHCFLRSVRPLHLLPDLQQGVHQPPPHLLLLPARYLRSVSHALPPGAQAGS